MIKKLLLTLPLLMMVACGKAETNEQANNDNGAANNEGANNNMADDHGEHQELGDITVFGRTAKVTQLGHIEAGKEGAVEVAFATGKERVSTVRAWIGIETGVGSMKGKMGIDGELKLHGHIEVPDPIPADSKLWMTFELDGKKETVSAAYK